METRACRFVLTVTDSLENARKILDRRRFDLVLFTIEPPEADGLELVEMLHACSPSTPKVGLCSQQNEAVWRVLVQKRVFTCLEKRRLHGPELAQVLRRLLVRPTLNRSSGLNHQTHLHAI